MTKQTVNVSIVAANYNNGKYLSDFINSIDNSTVLPAELIIIDDGSTDDSLQVLESFSNLPYLKVLKFEKNRGFCEALNLGVEYASQKYILRIDPDDIMQTYRIERQFEFLENNSNVDVVGSNVIYFNSDTKKEVFKSNFPTQHSEIKKAFLKGEHGVQHPSTMIRTSVMKKFEYHQQNVLAEDYEIFASMIKQGHLFANLPETLTKMRIHNKSASNNIRYETIKLTFAIRDKLFKTKTKQIKIWAYFNYILNYRKFLINNNKFLKTYFLTMAIIYYPSKLIQRMTNSKKQQC